MGWVLFVIGIAALVPPISWFAFLATLLWVLIASIWMTVQGPPAIEQAEPFRLRARPGVTCWEGEFRGCMAQ